MKCPHCPEATLVLSERQEVEIDYCPECRGIWLDRGELDKLLDRAAAFEAPARTVESSPRGAAAPPPQRRPEFADSDFRGGHPQGYRGDQGYQGQQGRRRKSWLSEIFD